MSLILGIDPSITATGIVLLRNGEVELAETTKNHPELGTIKRVSLIRERIVDIIENLVDDEKDHWEPPNLIVIEGFSFGSKGSKLFDIAYLGWRIREEIEWLKNNDGVPWVEVSPKQVKLFTTGEGNAPKSVMIQQVYKRWGFETRDDNIADAYALAQIGRAYVEDRQLLNGFQQEVIDALKGIKPTKKPRKKVTK